MSVKSICDMCGMGEPKVQFTVEPFKLQLPNYRNELYNFYVYIEMEKTSDAELVRSIKEKYANPGVEQLVQKLMGDKHSMSMHEKLMTEIYSRIENPCPLLCNKCKRKLESFLVRFGNPHKMEQY
jgi:hypothetical protein